MKKNTTFAPSCKEIPSSAMLRRNDGAPMGGKCGDGKH